MLEMTSDDSPSSSKNTFFALQISLLILCSTSASCFSENAVWAGWTKMPLLTPEQRLAGIFPGGEGSQWPRGPIAVSPADSDFLLLPIDVGGVYRSLDGGKYWEIAMAGWNARGANGFGIDPRNASRAIGIGANSMNWNPDWGLSPNGLYLTTNQAASWKQVKMLTGAFGGNVAFDVTMTKRLLTPTVCVLPYSYLLAGTIAF
jgi:hypothetical protein